MDGLKIVTVYIDDTAAVHFGPFDIVVQREEIEGREWMTFRGRFSDGELGPPWCERGPCRVEVVSH